MQGVIYRILERILTIKKNKIIHLRWQKAILEKKISDAKRLEQNER